MSKENNYSSKFAHKPAKDHPWKKGKQFNSEIARWARGKSEIMPVNNVRVATLKTLNDRRR